MHFESSIIIFNEILKHNIWHPLVHKAVIFWKMNEWGQGRLLDCSGILYAYVIVIFKLLYPMTGAVIEWYWDKI